MRREPPVRFREGLGVQLPRATRLIVGFQHRRDAERFSKELRERLQTFGLALHPDKTRLIEFGRFAAENRPKRGEGKPETFDFLGFTHLCGRKRQTKGFAVKRKTIAQRLRSKIQAVKASLMKMRHLPIPDQGRWLRYVVKGYFNYFAIPGNTRSLETFHRETVRSWLQALRRRSSKHRMPWERFGPIAEYWIPKPKILHPHPNDRFYAKHPK